MKSVLAAVFLAALPAAGGVKKPVPAAPNVLVIALSSVRADAIGEGTPNLTALAARGVTYTARSSDDAAHSTFSLLTGYDPDAFGAPVNCPEASLPDQLERFGYRTFAVTAGPDFGLGALPQAHAFEDYLNLSSHWSTMTPTQKAAYGPRLDGRAWAYGVDLSDYDRSMLFASASEVLAQLEPRLDAGAPFFGFVNFADAEDPYLPDPLHYDRSDERALVPSLRDRPVPEEFIAPEAIADEGRRELVEKTHSRSLWRAWATTLDLTPEQLAVYRMRYLAEVREADRAVGRVLHLLERHALSNSTIVVVVTLGGEELGETDLLTHSFRGRGDRAATTNAMVTIAFPEGYRVGPHAFDTRIGLADIAPTLYEIFGIDDREIHDLAPQHYGTSRAADFGYERRRGLRAAVAPALPAAFDPPDDRRVTIDSPSSAEALRAALLRSIWGRDRLPDTMPAIVAEVPSPIAGLKGLARVDDLRTEVDGLAIGQAYHFVPAEPNGELILVHAGHGCEPLDDGLALENGGGGMARTIAGFVEAGYGVAAIRMPQQRPDDCVPDGHAALFANGTAQGLRYFLEPVAAVVNALAAGKDGYRTVHMVGFSGGGWATVLYAALDPRIRTSVSVAGSLPIYLRRGDSRGDSEQILPEFYAQFGYPDLYVLDASDPSRLHVQVFIENDSCCFSPYDLAEPAEFEPSVREYETRVQNALEAAGGGTFTIQIDRRTPHHTISRSMLDSLILPVVQGDVQVLAHP